MILEKEDIEANIYDFEYDYLIIGKHKEIEKYGKKIRDCLFHFHFIDGEDENKPSARGILIMHDGACIVIEKNEALSKLRKYDWVIQKGEFLC